MPFHLHCDQCEHCLEVHQIVMDGETPLMSCSMCVPSFLCPIQRYSPEWTELLADIFRQVMHNDHEDLRSGI